jgi:hypothetical protein
LDDGVAHGPLGAEAPEVSVGLAEALGLTVALGEAVVVGLGAVVAVRATVLPPRDPAVAESRP